MPIEIKELYVRINVDDSQPSSRPENNRKKERANIIAACVEQVMEIMSKKAER